jgi:hypothetical protein
VNTATSLNFPQLLGFIAGGRNKRTRTVANNVVAERVDADNIHVYYHGNRIAELDSTGGVHVTNAGWSTSTARERINVILSDNSLPFYVAQRNYAQVLFQRSEGEHAVVSREFETATFDRDARVYSINGSAAIGY